MKRGDKDYLDIAIRQRRTLGVKQKKRQRRERKKADNFKGGFPSRSSPEKFETRRISGGCEGEFLARADISVSYPELSIFVAESVRRKSIRPKVKRTACGECFGTLSRGQRR